MVFGVIYPLLINCPPRTHICCICSFLIWIIYRLPSVEFGFSDIYIIYIYMNSSFWGSDVSDELKKQRYFT